MKRNVLLIICAVATISFISCGDSTSDKGNDPTPDGSTGLSFNNSSNSDGKINDIVWAEGNATWNKTAGYDRGATTESKTVTSTAGGVEASVDPDNSGDYVAAEVTIPEANASSLAIEKGYYNNYTIVATAGAAAVSKKNK